MSLHLDNKKKKNNTFFENFYFINIFSMSSVENNKYNLIDIKNAKTMGFKKYIYIYFYIFV